MTRLLTFVLASVCTSLLFSRPSNLDSLMQVWESTHPQDRYELSLVLGTRLAPDSLDKALFFFVEAAEIADKANAYRASAKARILAANMLEQHGQGMNDRRKAVNIYLRANTFCKEAKDSVCQAQTWLLAGKGYLHFEQFERAMHNLVQAAMLFGQLQDSLSLLDCSIQIGSVLQAHGDMENAIWHHQKALEIAERLGQDTLLATIKFDIGLNHLGMGNHHAARVYLEESLRLTRFFHSERESIGPLNALGETLLELGEYAKAENTFIHALDLSDKYQDRRGVAESNWGLGAMFLKQNHFPKAKAFLENSIQISEEYGFEKILLKSYKLCTELYIELGEVEKVTQYTSLFEALQEEVVDTVQRKMVLSHHVLYDYEDLADHSMRIDKDLQIKLTELKAKRAQIQVAILIGVLLLVLAAFSYRQSVAKQRTNQHLERLVSQRTEDLQLANEELDTFAYRTAHDIRGPVARLLGLIQVASHENDPDQTKHFLELLQSEAVAMDVMLHRFLEVNHLKHIQEEDQLVNVQTVLAEVLESCKEVDGFEEVEVQIHVEPGLFLKTKPRLFKIMLKNMIENGIIFRKKHGKNPSILSIHGTRQSDQIAIKILDNGIGIDERVAPEIFNMFYRGTHASTGLGLGLYATRQAADRLGMQVRYVPDNEQETEFRIEIPT